VNESSVLTSTTLRYEEAFGSAGAPSWTGNISSWSWTHAGQGERSYVFGYDGLGRLTTTSQYLGSSLEDKYGSESPIVVKYNILNLPAQETTEGDLSAKARYLSDGTKLCIVDADESRGYYHYGPFRRDVPSGTDLNVSVPGGLVWACEDVYTVRYISAVAFPPVCLGFLRPILKESSWNGTTMKNADKMLPSPCRKGSVFIYL
jgi:hypothetical protein